MIINGWTHLRRVAQEYTVRYETPRWAQRGASVTREHWSGTVRLRSERHVDFLKKRRFEELAVKLQSSASLF